MQNWMSSLPLDVAVDLVKDAFVSAGERDIYTVSPLSSYMLVMDDCQQSMASCNRTKIFMQFSTLPPLLSRAPSFSLMHSLYQDAYQSSMGIAKGRLNV